MAQRGRNTAVCRGVAFTETEVKLRVRRFDSCCSGPCHVSCIKQRRESKKKARNGRKKWTESVCTGRGLREEKRRKKKMRACTNRLKNLERQTDREYRERKTEVDEIGEKGGRPATKVRSQGEILCRILSIVAGASGFFNARDNEQTLRFSAHCQHKPSLYNVNTIRKEWQETRATNSEGKGKGWRCFGVKRIE